MHITIYGRDDCEDTAATREYLTSHNIPFEYINIDYIEEANQFVLFINKGMRSTPTVIIENHRRKLVVTEPTDSEMQSAVDDMS